jgi:hypothetical protein
MDADVRGYGSEFLTILRPFDGFDWLTAGRLRATNGTATNFH